MNKTKTLEEIEIARMCIQLSKAFEFDAPINLDAVVGTMCPVLSTIQCRILACVVPFTQEQLEQAFLPSQTRHNEIDGRKQYIDLAGPTATIIE